MRRMRLLAVLTAFMMVLAAPSAAFARGGSFGGSHSSSGYSGSHSSGYSGSSRSGSSISSGSRSGSSPSYSGSRSGSSTGTRSGSSAPSYSGSHSSTSKGSSTKAPSYSGSRSSGSVTRTGGSGPVSVPRTTHVYHVVVLPTHPSYGYLYSGHYLYHGVYYPYYYDGTYYSYDPLGYNTAAHHSSGAGWIIFGIVLACLVVLGVLFWFLRRPKVV